MKRFSVLVFLSWGLAFSACGEKHARIVGAPPVTSTGGAFTGDGDEGQGGGGGLGGQPQGSGGSAGGRLPGQDCGDIICEVGHCEETEGVSACVCPEGFGPPEQGCPDLNDCEVEAKCAGGTCRNTYGGYYCECPFGYFWNGQECADVDECENSVCHEDGKCTNEEGGFLCECDESKAGNGAFCKDAPDCKEDSCGAQGVCVETQSGFACQCESGRAGSANCSQECQTISLNPALEAAVRELVGLPEEAGPLEPKHLVGLDSLDASMREVLTLDGLECWPHLRHLNLSGTPLGSAPEVDPEPLLALSKLNKLETLNLNCTQLENLEGLREHPTLRELRVDNQSPGCEPSLTDVSAIASLSMLEVLMMGGHDLASCPPVENLSRLRQLDLGDNLISDISRLDELHLVEELTLAHNRLSEVDDLEKLSLLYHLDVGNNLLTTLSGVEQLQHLHFLRAPSNELTDVGALSGMPALVSLDISLNSVESLEQVAAHPSLSFLIFTANDVSTVLPFVSEEYVGTLGLSGNPLPCSTERENLDALLAQGVQIFGDCVP